VFRRALASLLISGLAVFSAPIAAHAQQALQPPPAAFAPGPQNTGHLTAELVSQTKGVAPGGLAYVAIRQDIQKGWHTYWRNPGDSGLPTRVKWTLPAGFEAGELRWPYPARFATPPLVSFGYEHEVLLPVEMRVPTALAGREVRLAAQVAWLECQEVCLPGKAEVSLTLLVRAGGPGPEAAAFADARKRLPTADPAWRFSAQPSGEAIAISFRAPGRAALTNAYFYATIPHVLDYVKPQALERTKTGYRLLLARDPNGASPTRFAGVLVVDVDGRTRAFEVDVAL